MHPERGDLILFQGDGTLYFVGRVGTVFENQEFANLIWYQGNTYDKVYSLQDARDLRGTAEEVSTESVWSDVYGLDQYGNPHAFRGFTRVSNELVFDRLVERFGWYLDGAATTSAESETGGKKTSGAVLVPPESNVAESFEVDAVVSEPQERRRREAALQQRYCDFLRDAAHTVMRHRIPRDEGSDLATDLFDVTADELIEVKASTDRNTLRLALGQVLDYHRYVNSERKAVLLPSKPERDMMDLFKSFEVRVNSWLPLGIAVRTGYGSGNFRAAGLVS